MGNERLNCVEYGWIVLGDGNDSIVCSIGLSRDDDLVFAF